jgi:hypothetical protein
MEVDVQLLASEITAYLEIVAAPCVSDSVTEFRSVVANTVVKEGRSAWLVGAWVNRGNGIAITREAYQRLAEILSLSDWQAKSRGSPCTPSKIEVLNIGSIPPQIKVIE